MNSMQTLTRPDGQTLPYYRAQLEGAAAAPGVILVQEWWGINDQIRHMADRLASAGFTVLVPDLYRGKVATSADEASHMMSQLDWGSAVADIQALANGGDEVPTPFGLTGFCMGGALTFLGAAAAIPTLKAAVPFYGLPQDLETLASIRIPLQGHFATRDSWCSPEAVAKAEVVLQRAGVVYEFHWYEADHAFMNEARPEVYQPEAAQLAWERMVAFFRQYSGN